MKFNWKQSIAAVGAGVMLVAAVPTASFAMDFSAYNEAMAQYQAAFQAQQQEQQDMIQAYMEAALFNPAEAYRILVSCKNGVEREKYFFSLNEYQRFRLLEYLGKMIEEGHFRGFDDFDIPGLSTKDKVKEEEKEDEEILAMEAEAKRRREDPEYAEQKKFEEDYAVQIDLYRKFGDYADLSSVPVDVAERIKEFVKEQDAKQEELTDEDDFYVPVGVHASADDSDKSVTIFTTLGASIKEGETVTLSSMLKGFEDCSDVLYVWMVDKGSGFERVPGANETTYSYKISAESLSWRWNLEVYYRLATPTANLVP